MGTDEYVVLTPLSSKIASDAPQDFALFREEPFICSPKTEDILRPIDMLSQEAGFTPNIIFEGGQDLLSRLQPLGYGNIVAFISRIARPEYRAQCEKFSRIVSLTNNCARYNVHIVWDPRRTLSHAFSAGFPARPETKNPRCRHLGFPSTAKTKSIPSKTRPEPSEHSCVTTATWKQSPWQDMPDTKRYFPLSIFPFCDLLFFQRFLSHG